MLLLVEDDVVVASATRRLLRPLGCAVEIAHSAAQGAAAVQATRFDAVLCDMHLGDGTAADVLIAMELGGDPPPMLLMTGWIDDRTDAIVAQHPCVRAVVAKSTEPSALREMVRRLLAG